MSGWLVPLILLGPILVWSSMIAFPGNLTQAQESGHLISVRFISSPAGASVSLDGNFSGVTPLETQIEPGEYSVRFSMPGFVDWEDEFVVVAPTGFSVTLHSSDELKGIHAEDYWVEWDNRGNRIQLTPYRSESDFGIATYDAELETIDTYSLPFYWLQDATMRQALGVANPDHDSISAIAYESPSGRYIAYVPPNKEPTLAIYDKERDITIPTDVRLPPYSGLMSPEYRLRWSPNEQFVYVKRSTVTADCRFVSLKTTGSTSECVTGVFDDHGDPYLVKRFLGSPNDNGQILAILYDNEIHSQLWLINLVDVSGLSLGFENVFDAAFSISNANMVYIAYKDGLVRYDLISGEQVLIESLIDKLPVLEVSLAPTLDYALLHIGKDDNTSYWMYSLPSTD